MLIGIVGTSKSKEDAEILPAVTVEEYTFLTENERRYELVNKDTMSLSTVTTAELFVKVTLAPCISGLLSAIEESSNSFILSSFKYTEDSPCTKPPISPSEIKSVIEITCSLENPEAIDKVPELASAICWSRALVDLFAIFCFSLSRT